MHSAVLSIIYMWGFVGPQKFAIYFFSLYLLSTLISIHHCPFFNFNKDSNLVSNLVKLFIPPLICLYDLHQMLYGCSKWESPWRHCSMEYRTGETSDMRLF